MSAAEMSLECGIQVGAYESGGETRQVIVAPKAGEGACVAEMSEGPLTDSVFGGGPRYHEVDLDVCDLSRLGWLLGASQPCVTAEDIAPLLRGFFGDNDRFLSDLMDEMDGEGVRYSYLSCIPGDGVWFRPADAGHDLEP